ncbi:DUF4352 domain-containing protein [Luedemannella flava]
MVLGLVTLAAFTIACSSGNGDTKSSVTGGSSQNVESAATEKTTATAKVGQTVTLTNDTLGDKTTVEITVANPKQFAVEPGDFGSKPDHGVFVVFNVTVVCKQGTYSANPFNFKFVAKDGTVSEGALTVNFKPALNATDLSSGQKVAGKIVFDVPKAAISGGKVQVDGVGLDFDKPAAYWAL